MINQLAGTVLRRLAANSTLFHLTRSIAYAGTFERLAPALGLAAGERLLDVGCGTGVAAELRRGLYVGIDRGLDGVQFAHRTKGSDCAFAAMSADALAFRPGAFDKAACINMVHHLNTPLLEATMRELRRVVRGRVIVLDVAPDAANALERFFLRHDRGEFVRSRDELRAILSQSYRIESEEVFHNTAHTIAQVLFRLVPR